MISEELKLIVDKFNEQGKMNFLEETTEEKISEFEKGHLLFWWSGFLNHQ